MEPTAQRRVLAARIRQARRSMPFENGRRVSQATLARKIGVAVMTISQWERGKAQPTVAHLIHLAETTGHSLESFLGDEDDEEAARRMQIERGLSILDDLRAALDAAKEREPTEVG